jgi:hypothetical protein
MPLAVSAHGQNPAALNRVIRTDSSGGVLVRCHSLAWTEEGTYFRATNATLGTGVAMGIQTAFSATANVLLLLRSGSATKRITPHYIRLINTAAGASTTSSNVAVVLDTANRYSSGGTDLTGNIANAISSVAPSGSAVDVLRFNCTAAAAVAARTVGRAILKTQAAPCWTVGDEVLLTFGDPALGVQAGALNGAASVAITKNFGPCVLQGQNHCLLVHMWNPANATTAPSWEFEIAWWERDV